MTDAALASPDARHAQRREVQQALRRHVDHQRANGAAQPEAVYGWDVDRAVAVGVGEDKQIGIVFGRCDELHGCPVRVRIAATIHLESGEAFETARALDVLGRNRAEFRAHYAKLKAAGVPLDDEAALHAHLAEKIAGVV
jgi:hypothetical protein